MSLEIFSKFFVVSVAGGGLIAIPATTFSSKNNSQKINLFLENLSQKDQKIFTTITKQQLKESSCKVLVTDLDDSKSQIIVCPPPKTHNPNNSSVTFLYNKNGSNQLEKIEKFSNSVSSDAFREGRWNNEWNLQFQLSETRNRVGSLSKIKISAQNKTHFDKLKDISSVICKLENNKLFCRGKDSRSSGFEMTLDLSSSKDFSIG